MKQLLYPREYCLARAKDAEAMAAQSIGSRPTFLLLAQRWREMADLDFRPVGSAARQPSSNVVSLPPRFTAADMPQPYRQ